TECVFYAGAPFVGECAELLEEAALPAADLEAVPSVQVVAVDPTPGEVAREVLEARRALLRLLVARGVVVHRTVERDVHDEAAVVAEGELDVAGRESQRLLAIVHEQAAVHRNPRLLIEDREVGAAAGEALGACSAAHPTGSFHLVGAGAAGSAGLISGHGTGTMKRPP